MEHIPQKSFRKAWPFQFVIWIMVILFFIGIGFSMNWTELWLQSFIAVLFVMALAAFPVAD